MAEGMTVWDCHKPSSFFFFPALCAWLVCCWSVWFLFDCLLGLLLLILLTLIFFFLNNLVVLKGSLQNHGPLETVLLDQPWPVGESFRLNNWLLWLWPSPGGAAPGEGWMPARPWPVTHKQLS